MNFFFIANQCQITFCANCFTILCSIAFSLIDDDVINTTFNINKFYMCYYVTPDFFYIFFFFLENINACFVYSFFFLFLFYGILLYSFLIFISFINTFVHTFLDIELMINKKYIATTFG